ncbi:MAG: polyribonucleotide nucleotidyltransferase [Holosporales bacterium]|jgi:polyribonucleotide nucleotidyltransferase|nr:polyribonucleotide nucleotidyltransferase [Holosporales bacterium]
MFSTTSETINWGGRDLTIETGKIARQADGAVLVKYGGTTVLCTVVFAKQAVDDASFFPLTVNYQEKFYASGRIPGGFLKREGKPSDREVLIARLIDRPIRPLFPDGFLNEVQIVCTTVSYDRECAPEVASIIGASAALSISGVPFSGPIAACKVGYDKKKGFVLNPTGGSDLDLIVAGTENGILMVESEVKELSEETMLDAVMFGFDSFAPVLKMIDKFKKSAGKPVAAVTAFCEKHSVLLKAIKKASEKQIKDALTITDKLARRDALESVKTALFEQFGQNEEKVVVDSLFENILSEVMRTSLLKTKKRIDGRTTEQIRQIACEVDVLPNVHGSALFTRGETQALVVTTLGASSDEQIMDNLEGEGRERFMLHYNFPPFSVGEIGRMGAPGRREVGHGKLAWRAINSAIPRKELFPYTIRVVADITESNGSSSMATVCGASLSLMAAGVPIKTHVAGIAMGLIKEGDEYVILSDIMGDEDHLGDMDFKVAGTKDGITALQMDIKITSIDREIIKIALQQAKQGRLHILDIMNSVIPTARSELSETAPRVKTIMIDKDKIRELIGPGGKVIKEICEQTQAKIDIDDNGTVSVFAVDKEKMDCAISSIKSICCPPEVGTIFDGKVAKITDFGAFVTIGNKDGLVHISNISRNKIRFVADVLQVGQSVRVKVIGIDDRGKIKLSMKDL